MKQEITYTEAIGKTIEAIELSHTSGGMIIVFTDGTFTHFEVHHGYHDDAPEIMWSKLDLLDFGDDQLITAGVISQDELDQIRKQKSAKFKAKKEAYDRQEYERLKKKFGE